MILPPMKTQTSLILEYPPAARAEALAHFEEKLALTCDPADLAEDLANGVDGFLLIDARKPEATSA